MKLNRFMQIRMPESLCMIVIEIFYNSCLLMRTQITLCCSAERCVYVTADKMGILLPSVCRIAGLHPACALWWITGLESKLAAPEWLLQL